MPEYANCDGNCASCPDCSICDIDKNDEDDGGAIDDDDFVDNYTLLFRLGWRTE